MIELTEDETRRLAAIGVTPDEVVRLSRRIVRNAIKCRSCGEVVESTRRHHMASCSCPAHVAADGGLAYLRRAWNDALHEKPEDAFEDISEYADISEAELRARIDEILDF